MKCFAWSWVALAWLGTGRMHEFLVGPRREFAVSIWIWIAILVVIALLAFFTVSPASPDQDSGEPPPGAGG